MSTASLVRLGVLASCLAFISPFAAAAAGAEKEPPTLASDPWSLDDILAMPWIGQIALAEDGNTVAWIQGSSEGSEGDEQAIGQVFLRHLNDEGAETRQITRGKSGVDAIAFSPDGQYLAFQTDRPDPEAEAEDAGTETSSQIWLLPLAGGEAWRLTSFDTDVESFAWAGPTTLLVVREESPNFWSRERAELGDTAEVIDDVLNAAPKRLFRVELDGHTTRLTRNYDWIDSITVSPDGKLALVRAEQSLTYTFNSKVPPRFFLVDLEKAEPEKAQRREILAGSGLLPDAPAFSPDGRYLQFVDAYSSHPIYRTAFVLRLYRLDLETGRLEEIGGSGQAKPDPDFRGISDDHPQTWAFRRPPTPGGRGAAASSAGDELLAVLADGVHHRPVIFRREKAGWQPKGLTGTHLDTVETLLVSRDGKRVVFASSRVDRPTEIYAARLEKDHLVDEIQISDLHGELADKNFGKYEVLSWTGALGEKVEGLLLYPLDWQEGVGRRPLVLDIHGGPASADRDAWYAVANNNNLLWRQRGAFVFQPNYHGSTAYGLAWVESIQGRYYELEIPDIEKGVDHLIQRGLVDPDRLAATGWSNGGILTADLITRTTRYKAAVVGAADVEWLSDWANVEFGAAFDNYYFGGPPWERTQHYLEKSPFFRLSAVTTPTLIHTGTLDTNVPPHQSWSLFRALQDLGKVPVRLLIYPDEPHGLQQVAHQRRRLEEDYAWLDLYLFGQGEATQRLFTHEPLPPDSLLAAAIDRQHAARDAQGRLGIAKADRPLLPETVPVGAIHVGRFEVTRAQFAAFDPQYPLVAGQEDWPATGITLAEAQAYVAWLATQAPGSWRLPTADEAGDWAEAAGSAGITLDHWLGRTANPDDAEAAVAAAFRRAPPGFSLLKPVGSAGCWRPEKGHSGLFDLDGNAAEWAVDADGQGLSFGPSADRPLDAVLGQPAGAGYQGFRVVLDNEGSGGDQ